MTSYLVVGLESVNKYSSSDKNAGNILENIKLTKLNIWRAGLKVVGQVLILLAFVFRIQDYSHFKYVLKN